MNLTPLIKRLFLTLIFLITLVGVVEISKGPSASTLGTAIENQVKQLTKD
jgi:hypothetical protein